VTHPRWRFASLALAGCAVLAWLTWHSRDDLLHVLGSVSPWWIAASVVAGVALNVIYGLLFDRILAKYSGHSHPVLHVAVFLMSQPGKYLPGKLWQAVMQSIALGGGHLGVASVGVANIELSLAAVLHATGLGLACLFAASPALAILVTTATVTAGWALVQFPSGHMLSALFPRLRGWLKTTVEDTRTPSSSLAKLMLTAGALVANFAASWWLLAAAHTSLSSLQLAHLLASLWLGIAASLLALPIPAGLGIREAAVAGFGTVLAPDVPTTMLISIALLARCWQLLVDASSVFAGWLLWRAARRVAAH
jgi:uncharacterized membrane protein YbhN (UPF0104 family)